MEWLLGIGLEEELNAQMLCVLEWDGCGIYRESEKRNLN